MPQSHKGNLVELDSIQVESVESLWTDHSAQEDQWATRTAVWVLTFVPVLSVTKLQLYIYTCCQSSFMMVLGTGETMWHSALFNCCLPEQNTDSLHRLWPIILLYIYTKGILIMEIQWGALSTGYFSFNDTCFNPTVMRYCILTSGLRTHPYNGQFPRSQRCPL